MNEQEISEPMSSPPSSSTPPQPARAAGKQHPAGPANWHWPVRVYYEDTDAGGIVFYANYLRFFERARTEWLRHFGFDHVSLREQLGLIFVVKDMHVDYHRPAQLDDMLQIDVRLLQCKRASLSLEQCAWRGDTLLVSARVRLACLDAATLRPCKWPDAVFNTLNQEASE